MPRPGCCCGQCNTSCNQGTAPKLVIATVTGSTGGTYDGVYTLANFPPVGTPGGQNANYCYTYLFEPGDPLFGAYTGVTLGFFVAAGNVDWNLMFYEGFAAGYRYNGLPGTLPVDCRTSVFNGTVSNGFLLVGIGGTATLTFQYL